MKDTREEKKVELKMSKKGAKERKLLGQNIRIYYFCETYILAGVVDG